MRCKRTISGAMVAFSCALAALAACSSGSPNMPSMVGDSGKQPEAGPSCSADAGLAAFTPPADPGAGGVLFAASGEVLALTGYPFPPANAGDPAFVDGWD